MACTLAADEAGDEDQIMYEITCITRLLRDSGLHTQARSMIKEGRHILQRMGLLDAYSHRLDTLDLQIRQMNLKSNGSEKADIEDLLVDVVLNGAAVLKHHDTTAPAAAMLGQLLRRAKEIGGAIPAEANDLYAELIEHAKGNHSSLINAISAAAPSADELLTLIQINISTRYSDDVGYDIHNTVIAASRALSKDDYISDAIDTSFALEILADRGVGVPEWDEASEPPPPFQNIDAPSEVARSISSEGISVVQVGFDSSGRLVRLNTVNGHMEVPVREPDNVMLEERFTIWSKTYPYAYGLDGELVNQFYDHRGPPVVEPTSRTSCYRGRRQFSAFSAEPSLCKRRIRRSHTSNGDGTIPVLVADCAFKRNDRGWTTLFLDFNCSRYD